MYDIIIVNRERGCKRVYRKIRKKNILKKFIFFSKKDLTNYLRAYILILDNKITQKKKGFAYVENTSRSCPKTQTHKGPSMAASPKRETPRREDRPGLVCQRG